MARALRVIRLAWLKFKRRALVRERRRLHMERAGYDQALAVNAKDATECEGQIADELSRQRKSEFERRYGRF